MYQSPRILLFGNNQKTNKNHIDKWRQIGFSLIEMIIVIAIIGLILPAIFGIIFSIIQQQKRIYVLQEIKRQGDNALVTMETIIKNNAVFICGDQECGDKKCFSSNERFLSTQKGKDFYFSDKNNDYFQFYQSSKSPSTIASNSARLTNPIDLTSSNVKIDNFNIECFRSADYSPPIINLNFKISYQYDPSIYMDYKTRIKMKSY
ncbi:MAG: prepilin-type N-terminal cleavage/methylation domain-containing protein [Microgenomates group bacterium]|nr:prepilin-type N-terminal cleavage/methylation domain-containing protein [Microgenomates group bacterium]